VRRLAFAALMLGATLAAGQGTPLKSDWELEREARDWREDEIRLPPPPKDGLIEFLVSSASSFKFYIDPQSVSVGADRVVRFTLVARSPSGAQNVSYEGLSCRNGGIYRVYAFGGAGGWSKNAQSAWRPIEPKSVQRWHNELRDRYFCPQKAVINDAEEGLDALRLGRHPSLRD